MCSATARCQSLTNLFPSLASLCTLSPLQTLSFEAGSWVWITHEVDMFLPAKVEKSFKPGEEGQVKMEDGKVRQLG